MATNIEDNSPRVVCPVCDKRLTNRRIRKGRVYDDWICHICRRKMYGHPLAYGKALLSPRQRLTKLERQAFTICSRCGWFGHCDVHHKDENRENNNPDNFEILCPNCHTDKHLGKPII